MKHHGIFSAGKLSDATRLYRYLDLSQFLSFVEQKQLHLSRIKDWDDTWEAPASKLPTQNDNGKLEYPLWSISDDMFGQCWSLNGESDALWRIYSSQREGLLIQTTAAKFRLIKEIGVALLAPVIYYEDLQNALEEVATRDDYDIVFAEAFLKRKTFEHEQEVRLITINDERCLGLRREKCSHIYMSLDPIEFIEGITVDPRASDRYVETIQMYCKRANFEIVPKKSTLYAPNVFESTGLTRRYVPVHRK